MNTKQLNLATDPTRNLINLYKNIQQTIELGKVNSITLYR